jgi:hypothetical protein
MGFPLDRGGVEDGILTCHSHHARFDLESGSAFDLWADDTPTYPVEVRDGEVWVKTHSAMLIPPRTGVKGLKTSVADDQASSAASPAVPRDQRCCRSNASSKASRIDP